MDVRGQIERNDAGGLEPHREQILAAETDKLLDAGYARRRFGFGNPLCIDVDAEGGGAAARGGNDYAPVAAAKVDEMIAGPDLGEIEHALDQRLGCWPERGIEMMRRARPGPTDRLERAIVGVFRTGHGRAARLDPILILVEARAHFQPIISAPTPLIERLEGQIAAVNPAQAPRAARACTPRFSWV
jgi:hypothetical protein